MIQLYRIGRLFATMVPTIAMREFSYIDWLRRRTPAAPDVLVGPGDDCAVLRPPAGSLLVTTDMILDGTHFHLHDVGGLKVGRKVLAVNLSDIAAMAGRPIAAVVSVGLPRNGPANLAEELYQGMREVADAFATSLAGGDTNVWDGKLAISVTMLGEANQPVLRSGARPGDWLLVTGPLGGSILGKHLDFTPRVREAQLLSHLATLHAMMDISDGLAGDLKHICDESRCGAVLDAGRIPISDAAHRLAGPALDHALSDGEDFELLLAVSPEDGERLVRTQPVPGITLSHVGVCRSEPGMFITEHGRTRPLAAKGFEHE